MSVVRGGQLASVLAALVIALAIMAAANAAPIVLVNGGFDTGDLSGWDVSTPGGAAVATTAFGAYTPRDGSHFALITTGDANVPMTVEQSFVANAGDVISGCAFFSTTESFNNDWGQVAVINPAGVETALFIRFVTSNGVGVLGFTPWTYFESAPLQAGTYVVRAGVINLFNAFSNSYLGLDAVGVGATEAACPPPAPSEVRGVVWADHNGDGLRDPGELGVLAEPPVTVCAYRPLFRFTLVAGCTDADSNGNYVLGGLAPGVYRIKENTPGNQVQTFPGGDLGITNPGSAHPVSLSILGGQVATADFGWQPLVLGEIHGTKWNDLNGDGVRDPDEPGVAGVEICKFHESGHFSCTPTTPDGGYVFRDLWLGTWFVSETTPTGTVQTHPQGGAQHQVLVTNGAVITGVDFGNGVALPGSIGGTKWNDLNGNGVRDPGEPGVSGVEICAAGPDFRCAFSDADGRYEIAPLIAGDSYYVWESPPPGTIQTFPAFDQGHYVLLTSGRVFTDLDFGNAVPGELRGFKWNDANGNGVQEVDEVGVPSVQIRVYRLSPPDTVGTLIGSAVTDSDGNWTMLVAPGTYRVQEAAFFSVQTFPAGGAPYFVTVASGELVNGLRFGNRSVPPATIRGVKWDDRNADGLRDVGEPFLQGVTICVNPAYQCAFTNASGQYSFTVPAGAYDVYEWPSQGMVNTTPATQSVAVGEGAVAIVDFGNIGANPPPPEVTVNGSSGMFNSGLPVVFWGAPTTYTKDVTAHCGSASPLAVSLVIAIPESGGLFQQLMTNVGGEIWSATFPPFTPHHGTASLTFYVDCPPATAGFPGTMGGEDEIQYGGYIFIDPSGTVVSACNAAALSGATVTLLVESFPGSGVFVLPPPAAHIPGVNPQVTDATGAYGWMVIPGAWKVVVTLAGYGPAESAVLHIPPAVTDLTIALTPDGGCAPPPGGTPAQKLTELQAAVAAAGLDRGLAKALDNKLEQVAKELSKGKIDGACKKLEDFSKKLLEQTGKKRPDATTAQASPLIAAANEIAGLLGCSGWSAASAQAQQDLLSLIHTIGTLGMDRDLAEELQRRASKAAGKVADGKDACHALDELVRKAYQEAGKRRPGITQSQATQLATLVGAIRSGLGC